MELVLRPVDGTSITHELHLNKPSVEGTCQLWLLGPNLVDGVVGGDDQALGPDLLTAALELADEPVLVSPDLKVMTETSSLLVKVIDDHWLGVGLKSAPPLVAVLEVGARALGPGCSGLTCSRCTPEPVGSGLGEVFALVISGLEGLDVGFNLEVVSNGYVAVTDGLLSTLLDQKGVPLLNVASDVDAGLRHADNDGSRAGLPGLCLLAVLPRLEWVVTDLSVGVPTEVFRNGRAGHGVFDAKSNLKMEGAVGTPLQLGCRPLKGLEALQLILECLEGYLGVVDSEAPRSGAWVEEFLRHKFKK